VKCIRQSLKRFKRVDESARCILKICDTAECNLLCRNLRIISRIGDAPSGLTDFCTLYPGLHPGLSYFGLSGLWRASDHFYRASATLRYGSKALAEVSA
jgi:hypothetical protein